MKPTRREFLQTSALIAVGDALPAPAGVAAPSEHEALDGFQNASRHPIIRARLGMLDLSWFKREVGYSTLPNGITGDRIRQINGRYNDSTPFDFMMPMGVWTEHFGLPAVINECMMESYTGTLRLFPSAQNLRPARFQDLRAAGAFLVSAAHDGQKVTHLSLLSEKGKTMRLVKPWPKVSLRVTRVRDGHDVPVKADGQVVVFDAEVGERYRIEAAG